MFGVIENYIINKKMSERKIYGSTAGTGAKRRANISFMIFLLAA